MEGSERKKEWYLESDGELDDVQEDQGVEVWNVNVQADKGDDRKGEIRFHVFIESEIHQDRVPKAKEGGRVKKRRKRDHKPGQ